MPKSKLSKHINLLEPSFSPKTTWDKIYDWVFMAGRYIIVIVEMVVLVALGSRFYFDRKNNDLSESIKSKTLILDNMTDTEEKIKGAQNTLTNISIMLNKQDTKSGRLREIESNIPPSIVVEGLSMNQDQLGITGSSYGYTYIEKLENNFKSDSDWGDVNVTLTSSGQGRNITFTMTAKYIGGQQVGTE